MAGLFDVTKEGKGVSKRQVQQRKGFSLFMDIFFRRFWKLMALNLLYLIASIPAIYISFKLTQGGIFFFMQNIGIKTPDQNTISMAIHLTPFIILLMILFCGSGPATAGYTYVLKKFVNDTHAWIWSDFVKGFKENWKQSLGMYLINTVMTVLCTGSLMFYGLVAEGTQLLCVMIATVLLIFFMMQMYTHQLMVGFKLELKQIYKNAFILLVIKLPTNLAAMFVSLGLVYVLYNIVAVVSPAVFVLSFMAVMVVFFALIPMSQLFITRKVIQKYMIDEPAKAQKRAENKQKRDIDEEFEDIDEEFE